MKKTLLGVLMVVCILNFGNLKQSYASYEEQVGEEAKEKMAQELYDIGVFKGKSETQYLPALQDVTTAPEAITLIGRALKWDVDKNVQSTFTDVPAWAVPYTEYAKRQRITFGIGNGKFGEDVDGKRMVSWMLFALGENADDVWKNTEKYAAQYKMYIPTSSLRGDVVYVIYEGIKHPKVGEKESLLEKVKKGYEQEIVKTLPGLPREFIFSSGAGGWATSIQIKEDLTFTGEYIDRDLGDVGLEYPNGTMYKYKFHGEFENVRRLSEFEYTMDLKYLEGEKFEEKIVEGVRLLPGYPAGLVGAKKMMYYLPGKLTDTLPKSFVSWGFQKKDALDKYGLYNVEREEGWYSYQEND